jgi:hypothetical protein
MEFSKQFMKDVLSAYFKSSFSKHLPAAIDEALANNDLFVFQNFVPLKEASRRYSLSRKTLYNYHNRGYITLHSSEGKTFVSVRDLEAHINRNPLPRVSKS